MEILKRLKSEYLYLSGAVRCFRRLSPVTRYKTRTWPDVVDELARTFGDRPALVSATQTLTYQAYNARAHQYARFAQAIGLKKGDVVALLMPNCPEYLAVWLGMARFGVVTGLLNTNLQGAGLAHSVEQVAARHVIVDRALAHNFITAQPYLQAPQNLTIWVYGSDRGLSVPEANNLDQILSDLPQTPIPRQERPTLSTMDKCLYIYTSGTTGKPKVANINHYRIQAIMNGFSGALGARPSDRMYVCLPLYHSSGGLIAVGTVLSVGGSVFIADKFSTTRFWDDVVDHNCTMFQYIGELCRYLLNAPAHPKERSHNIRLCTGNGLRPDIWEAFQNRFQIPKILEWYAATESNAVLFNFDGKPGSVGRIPKWARHKFVTEIVQFDYNTELPRRNAEGRCIRCNAGEVGEVISQILDDPARPSQRFEGYSDPAETQRKILCDVFQPADRWFRTGDLMKQDGRGYFYFMDRVGDTFRWKGENASTAEIAERITEVDGVRAANVYGVSVPHQEGRAGMTALVVDQEFDVAAFAEHIHRHLAGFARPVFVRIQNDMDITGTFKQRKVELVKQGFNPKQVKDPLYVLLRGQTHYTSLTDELYEAICSGEARL